MTTTAKLSRTLTAEFDDRWYLRSVVDSDRRTKRLAVISTDRDDDYGFRTVLIRVAAHGVWDAGRPVEASPAEWFLVRVRWLAGRSHSEIRSGATIPDVGVVECRPLDADEIPRGRFPVRQVNSSVAN